MVEECQHANLDLARDCLQLPAGIDADPGPGRGERRLGARLAIQEKAQVGCRAEKTRGMGRAQIGGMPVAGELYFMGKDMVSGRQAPPKKGRLRPLDPGRAQGRPVR